MAKNNSTVTQETPERGVLSQVDARLIDFKLNQVGLIFLSLHNLSLSSLDEGDFSTAVEVMSKQGMRSLDACIAKLGGIPMGNFSEEFEAEAKEELNHE